MMFQTVYFANPKVWPVLLTVFVLFLSLIMGSLTSIGTTLVLLLTNGNNRL
uniref:Uncharacterized protein n=1 Tax=Anguilla anguilla TaxID=7936 RepID=A0A0E9T2H7_ANGAN